MKFNFHSPTRSACSPLFPILDDFLQLVPAVLLSPERPEATGSLRGRASLCLPAVNTASSGSSCSFSSSHRPCEEAAVVRLRKVMRSVQSKHTAAVMWFSVSSQSGQSGMIFDLGMFIHSRDVQISCTASQFLFCFLYSLLLSLYLYLLYSFEYFLISLIQCRAMIYLVM